MSRKEFSKAIKVARLKHATKGGVIFCEGCGAQVKPGHFAFDHDDPDGLMGEPTFDNCRVLCIEKCHAEKTKGDVAAISKAKRREAKHIGIKRPPGRGIPSPPPPEKKASRFNKEPLPWRPLFIKKGSIME